MRRDDCLPALFGTFQRTGIHLVLVAGKTNPASIKNISHLQGTVIKNGDSIAPFVAS